MDLCDDTASLALTDGDLDRLVEVSDVFAAAQQFDAWGDEARVVLTARFADGFALVSAAHELAKRWGPESPRLVDLGGLDLDAFDAFARDLQAFPFSASSPALAPLVEALRARPRRPKVSLAFDDEDALRRGWTQQLIDGGLSVPGPWPVGTALRVDVVVGAFTWPSNPGVVVRREGDQAIAEVTPGPLLTGWFTELREHGAVAEPRQSGIVVTRADVLPLEFARRSDFFDQWENELQHGTCFVPSVEPPEPRARVTIELTVQGGPALALDAEVVHRAVTGMNRGAGVVFSDGAREQLATFEAQLRQSRRVPTALVIDDEQVWRTTWTRLLAHHGVRVITASDGEQGLQQIIDHFFEIDLVVLDLHMPNLDGRGLLERVRRLGGESALSIFLVSAAPQEELDELMGEATLVLSKLEPIETFEKLIRRALELGEDSLAA